VRANVVKERLRAGDTVFGCFLRYPDPGLAEFVAYQGWDFIVLDGEHGPFTPASCENLVRAVELSDAVPIVRVPVNQPHVLLRYLDTGAKGCHVPQIQSGREGEAAVRAIKYHPRGARGLANSRAARYGQGQSLADYVVDANEQSLVVLQAESAAAVDDIDAIASVPDVDVVFIGPTDLSQSVGAVGDMANGAVQAAMDRIAEVVRDSAAALGVMVSSAEAAAAWQRRGAQYITVAMDAILRPATDEYLRYARGDLASTGAAVLEPK
jgi:4-hydroxy-2-oxoheptanedioate aldolase